MRVPRAGGCKDPADIMLAMDATEAALSGALRTGVSAIGVVSADVDFAILLQKLRRWGIWTVAVHPKLRHSGMCGQLAVSADEVVHYSESKSVKKLQRIVIDTTQLEGQVEVQEDDSAETLDNILISEASLEELRAVLVKSGFLTSREDGPLVDALVKFFHTNNLGKLTIWPQKLAIREAASKILTQPQQNWKKNPGNLALIQPLGGGSYGAEPTNFARLLQTGGPLLCQIDANLVKRVLHRFGYLHGSLDMAGDNMEEAIALFCRMNRKKMRSVGQLGQRSWQELHALLSAQRLQAWHLPVSDRPLRRYLQAERLMRKTTFSSSLAMRAVMQK